MGEKILDMLEPKEMARIVSRRGALRAGAIAAASVGTVPMVLAAMAKTAYAQGGTLPQPVIDVLNFALTLEYLESEFYNLATGTTALGSRYAVTTANVVGQANTPTAVFNEIRAHESAHVTDLMNAITAGGGTPVAKPTFDFTGGSGARNGAGKYTGPFQDVFSNPATFLALSQAFEDTGVRAYKGQAGNLVSAPAILTVALQIHSIEARHASKVRRLRGEKGWISGTSNTLPAQAQAVYMAGNPASSFPAEDNTVQAGVNVTTLAGISGNVSSAAASEAFDEPLDKQTVLNIASLFISPS